MKNVLSILAAASLVLQASAKLEFNRDIRPILSENCFQCHGFDKNTREAGLRLDLREAATADNKGVTAIVPGKPEASELVHRLNETDPDERMPPVDSAKTLTAAQKELLKQWVAEGAEYQAHWAYLAPTRPDVPEIAGVRSPIDAFIQARLKEQGLSPSPTADPITLARRLSFDLTGLPPHPELVEKFQSIDDSKAYEALIDHFLKSPHYGERMAVYWLDLVRWADTMGFHSDDERFATPYRDYVIQAFNDNMPFDQFTREQLAGDLFEEPTIAQRVASGYTRLNQVTGEGGAQPGEYRAKYMADKTRSISSVWMGATMGCAECHDHKFDPYTAADFYSMAAFFADLEEPDLVSSGRRTAIFEPTVQVNEALQPRIDAAKKAVDTLKKIHAENEKQRKAQKVDKKTGDAARAKEKAALKLLEKELAEAKRLGRYSLTAQQRKEPRAMRVLARGDWMDSSGPVVQPAIPAFMGKLDSPERADRMDLANWLVQEDNPLTARVYVNRLWYLFFGRGLSDVLDDLGNQGAWPTHPELLDWLAVEFVESGWDTKHLVKLLLMSDTYRQTSQRGPILAKADPDNHWFARQSPRRLDAEFVRDAALSISGLLTLEIGGMSVKPYQPEGYWSDSYKSVGNPHKYAQDHNEKLYRRGMYTFWKRTFLHPQLLTFDAPNREECVAQRPQSNTPLQALVLLNDPTFVEAARVFAQRILQEGGETFSSRITFAYAWAFSRKPDRREAEVIAELLKNHLAQYQQDADDAKALLSVGETPVPEGLDGAELAAWTSVARALLNLHETVVRM
ncbi:MAG: hypothetical protein ACI9QL_004093 [Candidatus Omnitrophota bacterium]|jgi:hypothetical protein